MNKIIQIDNLKVSIKNKEILKGITIPIYQNKITAIIGASGCGKSTLLKCINGSISDEYLKLSGNIIFEDDDIRKKSKQFVSKNIGLIGQTPTPFPFSVYKNMSYALEYFGVKDKMVVNSIIEEKLKKAGLYEEVKNDLNIDARDLSGGQQQRLCIARSLTVEPKVLLLDEPCSALDIKNTHNIETMLRGLCREYTIVIVTHNLPQAKRISDYTVFLDDGIVVEFGKTNDIFENAKEEKTKEYISYMGG